MHLEFIITISTIILGFIGVFVMFTQLNHQINSRFDSFDKKFEEKIDDLRKEQQDNFKTLSARIDAVNARLDTILSYIFNRNDKAA